MTTTTAPGISLDWATFEEHDRDRPCDYKTDPCSRQATHVATFRLVAGGCEEYAAQILYCLVHRHLIQEQAAASDGYFRCRHGQICTIVQLVRMEALR